jgi:hypothetical protein
MAWKKKVKSVTQFLCQRDRFSEYLRQITYSSVANLRRFSFLSRPRRRSESIAKEFKDFNPHFFTKLSQLYGLNPGSGKNSSRITQSGSRGQKKKAPDPNPQHWVGTNIEISSVADPDPPDPNVFGPPGSGSGSISQRYGSWILLSTSKKRKKNLDSYCFVTSF